MLKKAAADYPDYRRVGVTSSPSHNEGPSSSFRVSFRKHRKKQQNQTEFKKELCGHHQGNFGGLTKNKTKIKQIKFDQKWPMPLF